MGGSSRVFAFSGYLLYSLKVDPAVADFDRDGLRAPHEARLGTSDYFADTDSDGTDDGWEVTQTMTSPADAGSVILPAPFEDSVVLGASLMAHTWKQGIGITDYTWGPFLCGPGKCVDRNFLSLPNTSVVADYRFPLPLPETQREKTVVHVFEGVQWMSRTVEYGNLRALLSPVPELGNKVVYAPIDANTAVMISGAVWRLEGTTGAPVPPFAIIDVSRKGCEILNGPQDLPRCGVDPELSTPDIQQHEILGFDPDLRMVLMRLVTADGQFVVGIDATRVVRLANFTLDAEGLLVRSLVPMPPGS